MSGKKKAPPSAIKPGEVRNPLGRNQSSTGLQPFQKRVEHYANKFKPSEIQEIANDPKRLDEFPTWDAMVLKRMAATLDGREDERMEMGFILDRKEGKPKESKTVRVIGSMNDLSEEELAALAGD